MQEENWLRRSDVFGRNCWDRATICSNKICWRIICQSWAQSNHQARSSVGLDRVLWSWYSHLFDGMSNNNIVTWWNTLETKRAWQLAKILKWRLFETWRFLRVSVVCFVFVCVCGTANMIVELADLADPYIPVGSTFEESIALIFTFYTKLTAAKMQEVSAKLLENKMLESMRVLVSFIACFLQTTFSQKYIYPN